MYSSHTAGDYVLRAYDKCPTLVNAFQEFRASPEYSQMEVDTNELRNQLAEMMDIEEVRAVLTSDVVFLNGTSGIPMVEIGI